MWRSSASQPTRSPRTSQAPIAPALRRASCSTHQPVSHDPEPTIAAAHAELGRLLREQLAEPPGCQDPQLTADLITSLVVTSARVLDRPSVDPGLARTTLRRAIDALLDAATQASDEGTG